MIIVFGGGRMLLNGKAFICSVLDGLGYTSLGVRGGELNCFAEFGVSSAMGCETEICMGETRVGRGPKEVPTHQPTNKPKLETNLENRNV